MTTSQSSRHRPHHRLRQPGHAADRAPRPRGRRLFRDRSVPVGRGGLRAHQAEGGHPVRRPGLDHRHRQPARAAGRLRRRRPGARHLLWRADHVRPARRQGREPATIASSAAPSSRSRTNARCSRASGPRAPRHQVWMSHGDRVTAIPAGFQVIGTSAGAPFAAIADETRKFYGMQFHPEVVHTPDGAKLLRELRPQHRRHQGRLDHARLSRARGRRRSASRSATARSSARCRAASIPRSRRC